MNSKAQAWFVDFAIALVLFIFTLVIYFSYTTNFQKEEKGELDLMLEDARSISSSLTLSGYPNDWGNTTVVRIGVSNDQKINVTKLFNFKRLDYNNTRKKFATVYDYFVFFTNNIGDVLNVWGVCGVGNDLVNTRYNTRSAYYYKRPSDSFLRDFMSQILDADIYFDDNVNDIYGLYGLVSNISKYKLVVLEHPLMSSSDFDIYKDELENFSSHGGLFIISGELAAPIANNMVGVDFQKRAGQSQSRRSAIVNNADYYLSLSAGQSIVFTQYYFVQSTPASSNFKTIATFNQTDDYAIARWQFGNGTVYFFSDLDVSFFDGDFIAIVEDAASRIIEGTCYPINIAGISQKKLVKTERYLIYNSKIVKMVVYVWQ